MRGQKKIIIPVVAVVLLVLLVLIYLFQTGAFKTKLQKFEEYSNSHEINHIWEYYEHEIQGTRNEERGREVMLNALENTLEIGLSSYEVYQLIENHPDYLIDIVDLLKEFQTDAPLYERANATLTVYQSMLDLSNALTDPFDIYASPSEYYGKTVTLIGEITSNDVRRRMLQIDVGNYRSLEISYEYAGVVSLLLNEEPAEKGVDEWLHIEGGYIVATGAVKQYSDSTNAFLATVRISELGECNWETISNYIN